MRREKLFILRIRSLPWRQRGGTNEQPQSNNSNFPAAASPRITCRGRPIPQDRRRDGDAASGGAFLAVTGLAEPHFGLSSSFHARNPSGSGGGGSEVTVTSASSRGTRIFQRVITSPSYSTAGSRRAPQPAPRARPATALRLRDGKATAPAAGGADRGRSARAARDGPGLPEGSSAPCWGPPLPPSAETRRPRLLKQRRQRRAPELRALPAGPAP